MTSYILDSWIFAIVLLHFGFVDLRRCFRGLASLLDFSIRGI